MMPAAITCRHATLEEILPLRHRVLRDPLPLETACFECDLDSTTRHLAALRDEAVVGCLTLAVSTWEGRPAWQLRGMATEGPLQRQGIGQTLLTWAVADAAQHDPGRIAWCNARTSAIGFYERLGWRVASEPFEIPTAGPHVKMVCDTQVAGGGHSLTGQVASADAMARTPVAGFIAIELALLVAMHFLGGPLWVALGACAVVGQILADFRIRPLVGLGSAVFWAAAHHLSGNRELFFPYAMALAVHLAGQFIPRGRWVAVGMGGLIVVVFMSIRVVEQATLKVLAVELAVAAVILAAAVALLPRFSGRPWALAAVTAVASLAAYAGLVF